MNLFKLLDVLEIYGFKAAYSRMDLTMVVYLAALTLMLQSLKFLQ